MKILLTGVTGYIGRRLLPVLLEEGHEVVCMVRDEARFEYDANLHKNISVIEGNVLKPETLVSIPKDIDCAYYFIHSMSQSLGGFANLEAESAKNFRDRMDETDVRQVIYLSGIVNDNGLSEHLESRKRVEDILGSGAYGLTTLRAGIIVGSGSASFEIIRDLVEKLPVMIAPKWLNTRIQPIAIRNVIQFLNGVLNRKEYFGKSFDIGGPEVLTYKDMLLGLAKVRKLKRSIITVPVMTPKLSSYWLYFVTSTSYNLAVNLVDSMKVEVIGSPNDLAKELKIDLLAYEGAVKLAFDRIEQNEVVSSWTDAVMGKTLEPGLERLMKVPRYGCLKDARSKPVESETKTLSKIWSIGGDRGWYYGNALWGFRGFLDKMVGGVGLRRGRKHPEEINPGETLDFWRVIVASKTDKRLLLYAEMKLPGEAWLEFQIKDGTLHQTATFRPKGLGGRLYWLLVLPFHYFIFQGMLNRLAKND